MSDFKDSKDRDRQSKPVDPNPNPQRHPSRIDLDKPRSFGSFDDTDLQPTPYTQFWMKAILTVTCLGLVAVITSLTIWLCSFILGTVF